MVMTDLDPNRPCQVNRQSVLVAAGDRCRDVIAKHSVREDAERMDERDRGRGERDARRRRWMELEIARAELDATGRGGGADE